MALSREEQIKRTINLAQKELGRGKFGIIRKRHRLFYIGDLVVVIFNNGQSERFPVWSVTSRGYTIINYYLALYKWWYAEIIKDDWKAEHGFRRIIRGEKDISYPATVEIPDQLKNISLFDPGAQEAILETLRARGLVRAVGTGSRAI